MLSALNEIRRTLGLPTLPTITGRRRASRLKRRQWHRAKADSATGAWVAGVTRATMEAHRNLEARPDALLGEPDADQDGRLARMIQAVARGFGK